MNTSSLFAEVVGSTVPKTPGSWPTPVTIATQAVTLVLKVTS